MGIDREREGGSESISDSPTFSSLSLFLDRVELFQSTRLIGQASLRHLYLPFQLPLLSLLLEHLCFSVLMERREVGERERERERGREREGGRENNAGTVEALSLLTSYSSALLE